MASIFDELGFDDETDSERLARELAEADIELVLALKRVRLHRRLSQTELGARMGVSQATVSDFEGSSSEPNLATVRRYAHALGASIEHIVRVDEQQFTEPLRSVSWTPTSAFTGSTGDHLQQRVSMGMANAKRTDFALGA